MPTISELIQKLEKIDNRVVAAIQRLEEDPDMQEHEDAPRIIAHLGMFRSSTALFIEDCQRVALRQPRQLASVTEADGYVRCAEWLDWLVALAQERGIDLTEEAKPKKQ